jgi:hypothetical protein
MELGMHRITRPFFDIRYPAGPRIGLAGYPAVRLIGRLTTVRNYNLFIYLSIKSGRISGTGTDIRPSPEIRSDIRYPAFGFAEYPADRCIPIWNSIET